MEYFRYFVWHGPFLWHEEVFIGYMREGNLASSSETHISQSWRQVAWRWPYTSLYMWNQIVQQCRLFIGLILQSILLSPAVEWMDAGTLSGSMTFGWNGTMNNTQAHKHTCILIHTAYNCTHRNTRRSHIQHTYKQREWYVMMGACTLITHTCCFFGYKNWKANFTHT